MDSGIVPVDSILCIMCNLVKQQLQAEKAHDWRVTQVIPEGDTPQELKSNGLSSFNIQYSQKNSCQIMI